MKISTRGRYALKMMTDLAIYQEDGFINLKEIANRQKISKKYLEQIIPILNKEHILSTSRGAQGGYRLASDPSDYVIGDILRLTEGSIGLTPWLDPKTDKPDKTNCEFWDGLNMAIANYMDSYTLEDLVDSERERMPELSSLIDQDSPENPPEELSK